jgi:hypothetical protein
MRLSLNIVSCKRARVSSISPRPRHHQPRTLTGGGVYSTGANASLSIAPGVVFLANTPDDVS